jgi:3-O-methylgallate 3,4-dioxygenase
MRKGEGEGHGMAYVHRRLMDETSPVPIVPVFLNTYFAPNQPRPRRCYELGLAICKAVETFPGDARIGIIASGGLSHFLVDEDFDRAILKACADKDAKFLQRLGRRRRRLRASRPELVRICAWLSHAGRYRHRFEFCVLGVATRR